MSAPTHDHAYQTNPADPGTIICKHPGCGDIQRIVGYQDPAAAQLSASTGSLHKIREAEQAAETPAEPATPPSPAAEPDPTLSEPQQPAQTQQQPDAEEDPVSISVTVERHLVTGIDQLQPGDYVMGVLHNSAVVIRRVS
jgi:hypothetical protein